MTAQRLSQIQTLRKRNVKRFLDWDANTNILKDYFAGLTLEQMVAKNGKDSYAVNRILLTNISENWERDRRILNDYLYSPLSIKDISIKHGISQKRIYQIRDEMLARMERLGIEPGKEDQP